MKKFDLKKWLIEQKQWQNICFIGGMIAVFLVVFFLLVGDDKNSLETDQNHVNRQPSELVDENADGNDITAEDGVDSSGTAGPSADGQGSDSNPSGSGQDSNGSQEQEGDSETNDNNRNNESSTVAIEPQKDPSTEETYITFPCEVPGYDLEILKVESYEGIYVEDGTNTEISDVAAIYVYNKGNEAVEYAEIIVEYETDTLTFHVSALPEGKGIVAQEKSMKKVPSGNVKACTATVIPRAELEMSKDQVSVRDNGDDTITIKNTTNQTIPAIRVFYKYYIEGEEMYLGGIAFSSKVTQLGAGEEITIQPSHYFSEGCSIIRVSTYETDL